MQLIDFKNLDNKSKIQLVITAFLIVVFFIVLANSGGKILGKARPPKQAPLPTHAADILKKMKIPMPVAVEEEVKHEWFKESDYDTPWGRDPFHGGTEKSLLSLQGITWHERHPKAIIGGNIVGIGDKIGSNTVVDIKRDRVILNDGTNNFELTLD